MRENAQYLGELRFDLGGSKKRLFAIKEKGAGKSAKLLADALRQAGEAYDKLHDASAAEWSELKEVVENFFEILKGSFEEFKEETTQQVKNYAKKLEDYSKEKMSESADYIKNNPFKSILFAVALGFVIGRL